MRASSMVQAWLEEGRKDAFALQQIVRNMCNTGMTQAQVAQATGSTSADGNAHVSQLK